MSNAGPIFCAKCRKPVEFANRRWHDNTRVAEYTVQCHGKEDVLQLGETAECILQAGLPQIAFLTEAP